MQLGVDFGTTRTIVAYADRGNYPVATFSDGDGDRQEHIPTVVADDGGELVYGFAALRAAEHGARPLRSFKRALASPEVGPDTQVSVGDRQVPLLEVLTGFATHLRAELATSSSVHDQVGDEAISAAIAVPAHAHGAQRFLTLEAFRRAGFEVTAMINEPSAAGLEYSHRQGRTLNSRRTRVVVYDLGGGTFDASLVKVDGTAHEVLDSLGLNDVGGDDVDVVLADAALAVAGRTWDDLGVRAQAELLADAREAKERLSPQAKRIVVDVEGEPVIVKVADFYEAVTPLVERTIAAMGPLLGMLEGDQPDLTDIAGIYLVGGASGLPLVPRLLREHFGRRVHRSPYPAGSTAIGLAIAADRSSGYSLTDRLSRGFGVFREGESGRRLSFDPIIGRDEVLPGAQTADRVVVTRRYAAAHNVGWFRFVEYAALGPWGEPQGDIVPFAHVVFPFDPALQSRDPDELRDVAVERRDHGPVVEERYTIDPHGMIEVTLTCPDTGYTQTHALRTESVPAAG